MKENIPFEKMWEAYIEGRLSPELYMAFMDAVKSGSYDDWMGQRIDDLLAVQDVDIRLPDDRAEHILRNIQESELQAHFVLSISRPARMRKLLYVIAACAAFLALGLTVFLLERSSGKPSSQPGAVAKAVFHEPEKRMVHLPDGSNITLRGNSSIDIRPDFNRFRREVSLSGEGFFEIEHNPDRPFLVHVGDLTVTVLGTSFDVKANQGEAIVSVAVTSGKVKVSQGRRLLGVILPDQQIDVDKQSFHLVRMNVDADSVVGWKQEYLQFEDVTLAEAAALIESRFQVEVQIADPSLDGLHITASFLNQESLNHVMDVITQTVNVHYSLADSGRLVKITKYNTETSIHQP
jgi:ferric-dicitrate binding protein FerR (iron transport regulator)